MAISRHDLLEFIKSHPLAVVSTTSPQGAPEAALVNIAVSDDVEIVFDTIDGTRKFANLAKNPRVALVIGWSDMRTLQFEGIADQPKGAERERLKEVYFAAQSAGRARSGWPGLTYFRVKPKWVRFSNYYRPRLVEEMTFP